MVWGQVRPKFPRFIRNENIRTPQVELRADLSLARKSLKRQTVWRFLPIL
ncbi:hypothetical protein LEP1GSC070_2911 [Leptospira santarosai str. AIM]|nr:hypothetical protein LEP1GSC070_2911 [Leptospira santarosai str. AIM]